ncbi:MAG: STAS/SEC14 domain-containing protein [Thermoanaerobaculia bacterium]|nr:STAS/SEC14 domain-containing protein [Thermoanaerobaculia bacterium]
MSVIRVEAQLTPGQLLEAVAQLPRSELKRFAEKVLALVPRQDRGRLSRTESSLLKKINQGVPEDLQARFDALVAKRQIGDLAAAEHDELLSLTEQLEALDAKRVGYLAELARYRRTSLPDLMTELGIKQPPYA